jgi:hypothetical protein
MEETAALSRVEVVSPEEEDEQDVVDAAPDSGMRLGERDDGCVFAGGFGPSSSPSASPSAAPVATSSSSSSAYAHQITGAAPYAPHFPLSSYLPPVSLFHGAMDRVVPSSSPEGLIAALVAAGVDPARATSTIYAGASHTGPILEDVLGGDERLLLDIVSLIEEDGLADARARAHMRVVASDARGEKCLVATGATTGDGLEEARVEGDGAGRQGKTSRMQKIRSRARKYVPRWVLGAARVLNPF